MNKLNSIYVSILALVVAIAALVMCIMCCNNKQSVSVEQALLDNPEMIVNAMQKYEENMREQALAGAQKLIDANIEDVNNDANTPFVGAADAERSLLNFMTIPAATATDCSRNSKPLWRTTAMLNLRSNR